MTKEQLELILAVGRDDAVNLFNTNNIPLYKEIVAGMREIAQAGAMLPINCLQFAYTIQWDCTHREYFLATPPKNF